MSEYSVMNYRNGNALPVGFLLMLNYQPILPSMKMERFSKRYCMDGCRIGVVLW